MYPPPAIAQTEGQPANLDLISPAALRSYPLIVTRRDPAASRPPAAYRLLYQGAYYEVWGRRPGAPAALAHVAPVSATTAAADDGDSRDGGRALRSNARRVAGLAQLAKAHGAQLFSASPPRDRWDRRRARLASGLGGVSLRAADVTTRPPRATFAVPHAGHWDLWLQGRDHARGRGQRRRPSPRFDRRPAHRRRHRPRHDRAAARAPRRRPPSRDDRAWVPPTCSPPAPAARRSSTRSSSRRSARAARRRCT